MLLTDGNNEPAGPRPLDPEKAATLARDLGVTLHTIAIGRPGGIVRGTEPDTNLPVMTEVEGPNIALLERLAAITGGRAFVATDADALDEVFQTINALEKSPVKGEVLTRYDEHFAPWAAAGGLALAHSTGSWSEDGCARFPEPDRPIEIRRDRMDIIYRYDPFAKIVPGPSNDPENVIRELEEGHRRYRTIITHVEQELMAGSSQEPDRHPLEPAFPRVRRRRRAASGSSRPGPGLLRCARSDRADLRPVAQRAVRDPRGRQRAGHRMPGIDRLRGPESQGEPRAAGGPGPFRLRRRHRGRRLLPVASATIPSSASRTPFARSSIASRSPSAGPPRPSSGLAAPP